MTMMDDDSADAGSSMADDMNTELQRHADQMANILAEHGVMPDDGDEGSQAD
jgi:hypothetical protein